MIATVRGAVRSVGLDHVVIDIGGIGILVYTTPATAAGCRGKGEVDLHTSLVVREESLTLYGFESANAKELFEQVQTVSGVGPRLALAMLAVHSPDAVVNAISTGDLVALTKVPGVGKKSAERLVLELKDKMVPAADASAVGAAPSVPGSHPVAGATGSQVREALEGLGWSARQAEAALRTVTAAADAPTEVSALLRAALRELGR